MQETKQLLIADDEPESIRLSIQYFQEAGYTDYEFLQAPNGEIACNLAEKYQPDLIIMDWQMPVMDGIHAVEQLRSRKATVAIPIIIATGTMLEDEHLSEALGKGAVDYVRKPINRIELIARTTAAIALKDAQERERTLLQSLVDQKSRQLSSMTLHLAQKNELLQSLLQEIKSWKELSADQRKAVQKRIRESLRTDEDWERFQRHFEEVHPGFFDHLQRYYPALKDSDFRLCAYLRMRLENKEIAQLLNISPKGIETARYRLRKRLDLPKEIRLNEFIQQLTFH